MDEPLTPDEEMVLHELLLLDTEPHQIPPALFEGFVKRLARSCRIPVVRVLAALQGLNDKRKFDTADPETEK